MNETVFITQELPSNKGLDYEWLKEEGINEIQKLSGDIWTDYNEHDPGVTILEQLCYALTELSYRAELPIKDILTDASSERIDYKKQALFKPELIFPCNPVSVDDYRKLIIDRIPQVANVWLTKKDESQLIDENEVVEGLYLISLYVPELDECACEESNSPEVIKNQVFQLYNRHRELCEDVEEIKILQFKEIEIFANIIIDNHSSAEMILAKVLFSISLLIAPEIEKKALQSQIDLGISIGEILTGPLLYNGLINSSDLKTKAKFITVQNIIQTIVNVDGVESINNFKVFSSDNNSDCFANDKIKILFNEILKLKTGLKENQCKSSIVLYRNNIEIKINHRIVQYELDGLWRKYRQTYNLKAEYNELFSLPQGHYQNLKEYYSFQEQFPDLYGINHVGLAGSETCERKAQAKQLKGYLLVFDQILANYFSQLSHVKDLFSLNENLNHSYFYQYLNCSVTNVEPILKKGNSKSSYHNGLPLLINSQDNFIERRNHFLSFLLALYGQELEYVYVSKSIKENYLNILIKAKINWLKHLIKGTHNRGKAIDYLAKNSRTNIAGMQIKIRIQLGINIQIHKPIDQICSELGVDIVDSNDSVSLGNKINAYSDLLNNELVSVDFSTEENSNFDRENYNLMQGQKITESFLTSASLINQFKISKNLSSNNVSLLCQSISDHSQWHFIKHCNNDEEAQKIAVNLFNQANNVAACCCQVYLVEHVLLRYALENESDSKNDKNENSFCKPFDYSFTLTAVVSAESNQLYDNEFRSSVNEIIRENTPAHLLLQICYLNVCQMRRFEKLYWQWRHSLKMQDKSEMKRCSIRLKNFLYKFKSHNSLESKNDE